MKKQKLTDKKVKSIEIKDQRYIVRDISGVALRVSPSGKKTWLSIYQLAGRRVWHKLGEFSDDFGVKDAQKKHREVLNYLYDGIDPSAVRAEQVAENIKAPTVNDFIGEYLEGHAKKKKRSWKTDERILRGEFSEQFGQRKIRDITRREIGLFIETFTNRGSPIMANKVLAIIRKMFNYAVTKGVLPDSDINLLEKPGKERAKDRFLDEEEIRQFWHLLSDEKLIMSDEVRRAMKLVLVTAQRPGECIGINRKEIRGRWWTIPASRSKNKKSNLVYLSDLALELLHAPPDQNFYFEAPRVGKAVDYNPDDPPKAIHSNALPRALGRNFTAGLIPMAKFTPHDLRRTAATHMRRSKISYDVIGKILNHTDTRVTGIYIRDDYSDEIQAALEQWSDRLQEIISSVEKKKDKK